MRPYNDLMLDTQTTSSSVSSVAFDMTQMVVFEVMASLTDVTPALQTFTSGNVNTGTDQVTITGHGFLTGLKVRLTTGGALPTGLAINTDYYIIRISANVIQFATSQANALAGTAIDLTAAGSGTSTVTPQAIEGTVRLEKSDEAFPATPIWFPIAASTQLVLATSVLNWLDKDVSFNALRVVMTITSGAATISARISAKGV